MVVGLHRVFGERSRVLVWLVMDGRAEVVADLVDGTLAGVIG